MTGSAKPDVVHRLLHVESSGERARESNIQNWLYSIGVKNVEPQYITEEGPADLYLSNRRVIIEVKKGGRLKNGPKAPGTGSRSEAGLNESAFDQITRYILAERMRERLYLDEDDGEDLMWLGIVTDTYPFGDFLGSKAPPAGFTPRDPARCRTAPRRLSDGVP